MWITAFASLTGHTVAVDFVALVAISYVLGSAWFTCAFLTGLAAYRRGLNVLPVLLAAVLFPATWTVWHLQDERPLRVVSLSEAG